MEASELMIGDYLRYKSSKRIIQIESVWDDGVNYDYCQGELDWIEEEKIEPIPLTKVMLEANGLHYTSTWGAWMYVAPNRKFIMVIDDKEEGFGIHSTKIRFKYVHELQHALRLCGLKDLADNFKVG